MNTLASIIVDFAIKNNERYKKLRERVMRKAAELNNDVQPTIAVDGRLHAPFDGYYWGDREYHGGSYLPFTPEMWEEIYERAEQAGYMVTEYDPSVHNQNIRIKSNLSIYNELIASLEELEKKFIKIKATISHGQTWGDDDSCYIYIKTRHDALINALNTFIQDNIKIQEKERQERLEELKKLKGIAPEGRNQITGKILSIKEDMTFYSYRGELSCKVFIELENKSTVYGTLPTPIINAEIGDVVQFTASFTQSKDDNTHSFYKRPTKAKIIKEVK